jgi:glycine/D-amino acid oxidase-like deaminating enzyme
MRTFDLIVAGAGIGSAALVYSLLKQGFKGSILVLDRLDAIAQGPSAYSAGGFRNLWTTPINQQLCSKSIELLKRYKDEIGVACGFKQTGYLFTYYQKEW